MPQSIKAHPQGFQVTRLDKTLKKALLFLKQHASRFINENFENKFNLKVSYCELNKESN
jgi:hypothetical protein